MKRKPLRIVGRRLIDPNKPGLDDAMRTAKHALAISPGPTATYTDPHYRALLKLYEAVKQEEGRP